MEHVNLLRPLLRLRRVAGRFVLGLAVAGCGGGEGVSLRVPTLTEAEALVAQIEAAAHGGDVDSICEFGGGNCQQVLAAAGRDLPVDPPTIIGARSLAATEAADGSWTAAAQILVVCGEKADGHPYRTEMLIFFEGERLIAIEPVYWSGLTVAQGAGGEALTAPVPGSRSC